jgi:hypothetical protein
MPVNLSAIKTKYLGLEWKDLNNGRGRVMNRLRKRKERKCPTQQSSHRSSSPSLVTEGRNNPTRFDPFKFSSKERDEKCSSQVIDSLRARGRAYSARSTKRKEVNLSPDELELVKVKKRRTEAKCKRKKKAALSIDDLNLARETNRSHQKRSRQKRSLTEVSTPSIPYV